MMIHLLSGFLGSGKTTAIAGACALLKKRGIKPAVILNDQGTQLVDSRFISATAPYGQVEGGCFCCNYRDLDEQIGRLTGDVKPDVIFAESVGSCTDLVATVLKPMLAFGRYGMEQLRYSTFVDATLLLPYLENGTLPFLPETNYIWQKQLEEASLLVVSKCDLLDAGETTRLKKHLQNEHPQKQAVFVNTLSDASLSTWLEAMAAAQTLAPGQLEVDYDVYARGEENLAWLDVDLDLFTTNGTASEKAAELINRFTQHIRTGNLPVGHVKFYLLCGVHAVKWSVTYASDEAFSLPADMRGSNNCALLVNARVQTSPGRLHEMLNAHVEEMRTDGDVIISLKHSAHFAPGYPTPTHRM